MSLKNMNYWLVPTGAGAGAQLVRNDTTSESVRDVSVDLGGEQREWIWGTLVRLADGDASFFNLVTAFFECGYEVGAQTVNAVETDAGSLSRLGESPCVIALRNHRGDFSLLCVFLGSYKEMLEDGDTVEEVIVIDENFSLFGKSVWRALDGLDETFNCEITGMINHLMGQAFNLGQKDAIAAKVGAEK